jgi:hypothetical protein
MKAMNTCMMVIGMMLLGTINSFAQNNRNGRQGFTITNDRNTRVERTIENNRGQQKMEGCNGSRNDMYMRGNEGRQEMRGNEERCDMGRNTYRMEPMEGRMEPMDYGMEPQPVRYARTVAVPVPVPVPAPFHPIGFVPASPEAVTGFVVGSVITGILGAIIH